MLYSFDTSSMSDEAFLKMYEACDKSRKLKIDRLKKEPDKKLSVAAGMLARRGIAQYFGISPKEVAFRCSKTGKPYADGLDIHYSLSHSGTMAVCAISDRPVGIDIEKVRNVNMRVAQKMFTPKEQYYIFSDKKKIQRRFFEIWTKKEAYVKKMGTGISDFLSFDVMGDKSVYLVKEKKYVVAVAVTE